MVNYAMKFSVADAARIFEVDKKVIKDWAYFFSDYLSKNAVPPKGTEREFNTEDIRVFAYIMTLWEKKPDIKNIKMGLDSNSHFEDETIDNLLIEIMPFFIEPPENLDESWKHGVLFGGLAELGDTFYLANSYKLAGDKLIEFALSEEQPWNLFCPAIYNYRHATELYMKAIIGNSIRTHDLLILFNKLQELLKTEFNASTQEWFKNIIVTFNDFDPGGTTFRYGDDIIKDETFVDFRQLKTLVNWMAQAFKRIRKHQGLPDSML